MRAGRTALIGFSWLVQVGCSGGSGPGTTEATATTRGAVIPEEGQRVLSPAPADNDQLGGSVAIGGNLAALEAVPRLKVDAGRPRGTPRRSGCSADAAIRRRPGRPQNRVGGELTLAALPHHRTCGSASGGSCLQRSWAPLRVSFRSPRRLAAVEHPARPSSLPGSTATGSGVPHSRHLLL